MRASVYSQADLRWPDPCFAAGSQARAEYAAHARRGWTRDARGKKCVLGTVGAITFAARTATLVVAKYISKEGHLTPESAVGYWAGNTGASTTLLPLLYPLHKPMRAPHSIGRLSAWFRIHRFACFVGAALILFPCNFKRGSPTSSVAFLSMLMAASGLGRYLYSGVHLGVCGRRTRNEATRHIRAEVAGKLGLGGCAEGPSASIEDYCRSTLARLKKPPLCHSASASRDDAHEGSFGRACESCHTTYSFKQGAMGR